ncbi:MAG TPA: PAS domain-containing protein [Acidobacteriaceae bacterium]|jgi:hypothetical protein
MAGTDVRKVIRAWLRRKGDRDPCRFAQPAYIQSLLAAGVNASNLGITLLDSQTRFVSVNTALARETRASVDYHIGKTSREIVGDHLANQIEPAYERVLATGKPESVRLEGRVRSTPETGYWFDYCFPVFDQSRRVQQLGLFVVNVTAEKVSAEIFKAFAKDPKFVSAKAPGLLEMFNAVEDHQLKLQMNLEYLACFSVEVGRTVDKFHSSLRRMDNDIQRMRELIYTIVDKLPIPTC